MKLHLGTYINPRSLEGGGGVGGALNFYSLTNSQKLWRNSSLFVNTSFDKDVMKDLRG